MSVFKRKKLWIVIVLLILVGASVASVGLFFGLYPARRAAKQDPILALHYE